MLDPLILASGSQIRQQMLKNAGVPIEVIPARIDEEAIRQSFSAEGILARDQADALAEMKARKVSDKHPDRLVLGCDQILKSGKKVLGKPRNLDEAREHLSELRGEQHSLLSAAVLYQGGKPIWRHVGEARLTMRAISDSYRDDYLQRNWESIRHSVGGYKLEEEGVRLFSRIDGSYFTILGLPLLEFLAYLTTRGDLDG